MIETAEQAEEELWTRLRRRKVVQWGIAYVAATWGLLQGLAYLSTIFQWPAALQRPAAAAFMVCLPIALVLAWYHGDRGHQRVSGREFWILIVLLLLGGGLLWWVGRMPDARVAAAIAAQPQRQVQDQASTSTGPSIAVLPFVNMSDDKANEYFSDGISEELLNVLVRVQGLGVASRTSSFAYKGSPLGTATIAQALKVDHVLEGSVRKSGNSVRITVPQGTRTVHCAQGPAGEHPAVRAGHADGFRFCARLGRARGRSLCGSQLGIADRDYLAIARQAAEHALKLDESLSMPWAVLANSAAYEWPVDWDRVLQMLDRAIVADPRNATAYLWRGISWISLASSIAQYRILTVP